MGFDVVLNLFWILGKPSEIIDAVDVVVDVAVHDELVVLATRDNLVLSQGPSSHQLSIWRMPLMLSPAFV